MIEPNDIATKDFIYQTSSNNPRRGTLTCRHCNHQIDIEIKSSTFLIFVSSKIKIFGKWCTCTNIEQIMRSLIGETFGVEQKYESSQY